jgi:hypothetical protein
MTPERRAAVESLGPVAHLYAPNVYHHLRIGEWAAAFPSARLHAPPGLARKRPDLRIDRVHDAAPAAAMIGIVDELRIDGFRLEESVLVYRPARTLVVADLVHNIGAPRHRWTRLYTRLMGFHDRVALSRMIRWILHLPSIPPPRAPLSTVLRVASSCRGAGYRRLRPGACEAPCGGDRSRQAVSARALWAGRGARDPLLRSRVKSLSDFVLTSTLDSESGASSHTYGEIHFADFSRGALRT